MQECNTLRINHKEGVIMAAIVQINFDYEGEPQELEAGARDVAPVFMDIEGLLWKIWLVSDDRKESGGIYLFSTRAQADAYAQSELVARLKNHRNNVVVKVFDTLDGPGKLTNAPVGVY